MDRININKNSYGIYRRSSSGYWYYWTIVNGKLIQKSTKEKTKSRAMKVLYSILDEGIEQKQKTILVGDFAKGIFDYETGPIVKRKLLRGYSYSRAYARNNQSYVDRYVVDSFGTTPIDQITPNDVEWWLLNIPTKYKVGNKTANSVLGAFRAVLDEARMQGIITSNPAAAVKPLSKKSGSKRRGCFTIDQVHRIFEARWENMHAYAACILAATAGLRMGEIRALTVEQVHKDYIVVDANWSDEEGRKCTKSGYARIVPIPPDVYKVFKEIMPPKGLIFTLNGKVPVDDRFISNPLYERLQQLGIDRDTLNLSFHSFRHYCNTRLVAAGIQGEKIRAVLGHESEEMTEHYMHLTSNDMSELRDIQKAAVGF